MFKFDTRLLQCGIALLNLPQHRVKSVGELAEFITGLLAGAHRIVSIFGDQTYGPGQLQNGIEDPPLKPRKYLEDDQGGDQQDHQHDRQKLLDVTQKARPVGADIETADAFSIDPYRRRQGKKKSVRLKAIGARP